MSTLLEDSDPGSKVEGDSVTTGARCGASMIAKVKDGPSRGRLVDRIDRQSGKRVELHSGSAATSVLDETVDLDVVSCSMMEDAQRILATQSDNIKGEWIDDSSEEELEATLLANSQTEPIEKDFLGIHHQALGETLAEYRDAIQAWVAKAYPQEGVAIRDNVGKEMFLDGLRDRRLAAQVRLKECNTLVDAYWRAVKFRTDRMEGEPVPLVTIDGASKQAERELKARRRQSGEWLKTYYDDIQFLTVSAYPGQRGSARSRAGMDAFLTGLHDAEIFRLVRSTEPSTLAEVFHRTQEVELCRSVKDKAEEQLLEIERQRSLQHFLTKGKGAMSETEGTDDGMSARTKRFADTPQ